MTGITHSDIMCGLFITSNKSPHMISLCVRALHLDHYLSRSIIVVSPTTFLLRFLIYINVISSNTRSKKTFKITLSRPERYSAQNLAIVTDIF